MLWLTRWPARVASSLCFQSSSNKLPARSFEKVAESGAGPVLGSIPSGAIRGAACAGGPDTVGTGDTWRTTKAEPLL